MFSPGVCLGSLSRVLTSPVWSSGCFWLLGAGSRPVGPLRSRAPSHSGVRAVRVGVPPWSLAHCGAPWLMAFLPGHCRISAGLASMDGPLLVSSDEPQLCECPFVVLPRQLVGSGVCSSASPICPTSSVMKRSSFGLSASVSRPVFAMRSPFRVESVSVLVGTKTLPPPPWCLVGVFALRSPCRVEFVSDLDQNEDSSRTFPSSWCQAFAMGSPVSGRVALFYSLDRNAGFFRSSILNCFAMGSPCGSCVFFSHSIVTKSTLDSWSVFLQDGVTPVGSGSDDLISNEGITTAGLLGAVFPARPRGVFVSSFGRPVCSEAVWVPHPVVFASGEDSGCVPLANEGVGLGPSSGPVASRPPLGIGLLRRPRSDSFHLGVSCVGLPRMEAC